MIATRHMSLEMELVRWLLLIVAALALVLAAASLAAAAEPSMAPQLLPDDMGSVAKPLTPDIVRPFFPEAPPLRDVPPAEAAAQLWTVLASHRAGRVAEAVIGWERIRLPEATAHWRDIALGAAHLRVGDRERATAYLEAARDRQLAHPVVSYFMGLVRLEQAAAAGRAPDGIEGRLRLVSLSPLEDKVLYETMALAELQQAIAWADQVRLDERLLGVDPRVEEEVVAPCVGDLLQALGADNFTGKAHHLVYGLKLQRGELIEAELNLDQAAATGLAVPYSYRDLAETYLARGRNADAVRAVEKDLAANHPEVAVACQRLAELARVGWERCQAW